MRGNILIVDDKRDMLILLERIISEQTNHHVVTESNPLDALERFAKEPFDLVITDLKMPKMDGIKLLVEIKKIDPHASVVIMTAYATIETAVEATQKGAFDYIMKPFQKERILLTIDKVMQWRCMVKENQTLRKALQEKEHFHSLVGTSPAMGKVIESIKQVAPTSATVLITGASGTGKELVAKAIHQNSLRSSKESITINCTAIPEQVMESELFGHAKGAFTGAWQNKQGLVERADKGTLFLDEIGDISLSMQAKLLRLLEQGEYRPVGGVQTKKADIRFIAATNHDLREAMEARRFREDLFFRLNVVHIELPLLSERQHDIPLLSHYFLRKFAGLYQKEIHGISAEAMNHLKSRPWPGNVRELENLIERAVIFCNADQIELFHVMQDIDNQSASSDGAQVLAALPFKEAKEQTLKQFYRSYLESLLSKHQGKVSQAAKHAQMPRQYLHQLMKEAGLRSEQFKAPPSRE